MTDDFEDMDERPSPIGALDRELEKKLTDLADAEALVKEMMKRNIDVLDEVDEALQRRAQMFSDATRTEDAIRRLGYVVTDGKGRAIPHNSSRLDGRSYSVTEDKAEAREALHPSPKTPERSPE